MIKFVLAWIPMVFIAIGNGLFREKVLTKHLSELSAHQASTGLLILLFGVYIWLLFRFKSPESAAEAWNIGLLWLVLTLLFEFLFGHYIAGHSWSKLLADYNILKGRLWILVLLWVTVAPYVFYRILK